MSPLEKKILELLPLLSEDAKFKARLILGEQPSKKLTKKEKAFTDEDVRVALCKALKIIQ
jgi:hypothetical protein|tara:strand:- start:41 stop:220 length:180 start_codon:yes stop_codon:yes gene_type:complete